MLPINNNVTILLMGFFGNELEHYLKANNINYIYFEEMKEEVSVEIVIIRSPYQLDKNIQEKMVNLKYIIRAGSGLDNIDDYYLKNNVELFQVAENSIAVSELAIGLILTLYRKISLANFSMRNGEWKKNELIGYEISQKRVGILGFGRIGQEITRILSPFNTKIIIFDRSLNKKEKKQKILEYNTDICGNIQEIFKSSDIVINCLPLNKESDNLINSSLLSLMNLNSIFINIGRGKTVNIDDLYQILISGKILGAALDVYDEEPPKKHSIYCLDNVVLTPHIGAQTYETRERIENNIVEFLKKIL